MDEMYNRSSEHAHFCQQLFETNHMKIGGPYTPLPLEGNALLFPSTLGGGNWGGVSVDPSIGLLFVNVMHVGQWGHMEKRGDQYVRASAYGTYARFWNRDAHIPCQNPPFGEMIAIRLDTGDIAWRTPLGRIEALEALGVRGTGTVNLGGSIATAGGLLFIAATNDDLLHAFDSKSGKLLWEAKLEAGGYTSPITYLGRDGRQYVALTAQGGGGFLGGGGVSNSVVAFALPHVPRKPLPATVSKSAAPKTGPHPPLQLPVGGAKALVEKTCAMGGCHSLDVVTSQRMSRADWNAVVQNMIARGAKASDAEASAIVEYLGKTLGR